MWNVNLTAAGVLLHFILVKITSGAVLTSRIFFSLLEDLMDMEAAIRAFSCCQTEIIVCFSVVYI